MKLTALEIKQQQFERSLRGYDTSEVQAFLSLVSSEWEHLIGKIRELEAQIDTMNEKLKHYERVEEALHETLQTAKDSAEQKLTGARKEAKSILEKAELEADAVIREANQQRQQIRQSTLRLLDRREEIIGGIKSYLELSQESLKQFSNDDKSLFSLPNENDLNLPSTATERNKHRHQEKPSPPKEDPVPPGGQNLDDILDELD